MRDAPRSFSRAFHQGAWCLLCLAVSAVAIAGDLTDRVQRAYRRLAGIRADFVQRTYVDLLEREVEEKGTILIARPNRFVIHYLGRRERKYVSNGKTLWIVRPGEETERIDNLREVVSREALAFLSDLGEMEKEWKVREEKKTLILTPRNAQSPFKKILLAIDPETSLAREVTLYPKNGNRSRYRFSRMSGEEKIDANQFRP